MIAVNSRILFIFLLFCLQGLAQQNEQEKLLRSIRQSKDTVKVLALIEYGYWFENQNLDSSAFYYIKAGQLAKKLHYTRGILKYYANYTYVLNQQGKLKLSKQLNLEALQIAKQSKDELSIADCLFNTGSSYNNSGDFETAVRYYIEAAKRFEKLGKMSDVAFVYDNIGGVFTNAGQYDKALPYNLKALRMAEKSGDSLMWTKTLINSAITQGLLNHLKESRKLAEKGLVFSKRLNQVYLQSIALNTLADLSFKNHHIEEGLAYSGEALTLAHKIDSKYSEMESMKLLASGYHRMALFDSAVSYADRAIAFGNQYQFQNDHASLYEIKADACYQLKQFENAFLAQKKADSIKDSIAKSQVNESIRLLEEKYQHAKNKRYISELEQEKTEQQLYIWMLVAAILIGLLLSMLIYKNIQEKKRRTESILNLKEKELIQMEKEQQLVAAASILKGQEEERKRLMKDLHDGLGGLLSGIKLTLVHGDSEEVRQQRALEQLDAAISEMRRIARHMMPESLIHFGLPEALNDFCSSFTHQNIVSVHLQVFGMQERLDQNLEISLYRIVQELVNNAIKHAGASEIYVQLLRDEDLIQLTVEDNGTGFDPLDKKVKNGIGLGNIRSRLELLQGNLEIQSAPGEGSSFSIEIKYQHHESN